MEGSAADHVADCRLFFILGASDELTKNLKKTAIRVSMRLSSSIEYLLNMPIKQFMELVEEIIEIDEEQKKKQKSRLKK